MEIQKPDMKFEYPDEEGLCEHFVFVWAGIEGMNFLSFFFTVSVPKLAPGVYL